MYGELGKQVKRYPTTNILFFQALCSSRLLSANTLKKSRQRRLISLGDIFAVFFSPGP